MNRSIKKFILLVIATTLFGCGASPFLTESKSKASENKTENIEGSLELNTLVETTTDNRNEQSPYIKKLHLTGIWQVSPSTGNQSSMLVLLSDENGKRSDTPLTFNVYLWMPSMGHGSFPITVTKVEEGIYELTDIFFTMPGIWDIHFEVLNKDKLVDEVKWELSI